MILFFKLLSIFFILASVYFLLWRGEVENAFVSAVFGSLAFFISIRFEIKKRMSERQLHASKTIGEK
ncbi:MAG: hypothetical protein D6687_01845 [Acidobacteria bacterium]|jgi:hypothetical protein|nr:MAG: hypothetical protein D6687_01845 [Acidobacteriota bacterium]GIU81889.1 MAG: hypothetical protein KatS3mg006_0953 [Pyrinomonadaceae bacterium]